MHIDIRSARYARSTCFRMSTSSAFVIRIFPCLAGYVSCSCSVPSTWYGFCGRKNTYRFHGNARLMFDVGNQLSMTWCYTVSNFISFWFQCELFKGSISERLVLERYHPHDDGITRVAMAFSNPVNITTGTMAGIGQCCSLTLLQGPLHGGPPIQDPEL